ncbi:MAG TPA: YceI family protein [Actinophytocola sp.]|uniref:YceI family protein n=1 Tax=Actinophytocola sp. TaxID=1872138 RepID=UPI002DB8C2F4|nr:YceI family protein [Actinophytocola sp.]HEU5469499.1 YceI family protein [Actinophytocola sp.]
MSSTTASTTPTTGDRPARKRRWGRRILIGLTAVVVLLVASVVLYVKLAPVPAPLALPATPANTPAGALEGTWDVAEGSEAGFRIQQAVLFVTADVVQRTRAVTGTLTVAGNQITAADFRVDLTTITSNGQVTPQLALSLDTEHHPQATITLTQPITMDPAFTAGGTTTSTASGQLTLRGITHPVSLTVTARRDGDTLQAAGSFPATFAEWNIPSPTGCGPLGSLADHGTAEFLLTLHHR